MDTRTVDPVDTVITEGALMWDLPATGTFDNAITLASMAGALLITKRKKTS